MLAPGLFKEFKRAGLVVYVESLNPIDGRIRNVFLHSVDDAKDTTTVARLGHLEEAPNGDRFVVLENGSRYEGKPGTAEYQVIEFDKLGRRIEPAEARAIPATNKAMPTAALRVPGRPRERAELFWRLSVPILALILTFLAIPMSYVNPRIGRSFNLVAAAFLYMVYTNCLNIVQSMIAQGRIGFWTGLLLPHAVAALLVFVLFRHQLSIAGLFKRAPRARRTQPAGGLTCAPSPATSSRDVLFSTLLIFTALLMLFSFFDLINEMRDVGKGNYTLTAALLFVTLNVPSRLYELFPVAALIGTLFAIAQLVANSEWTVMRASGASVMQLGWAVVRVGIPLALATFLAGEFVAPPAERLAQNLRAAARGDSTGMVAQQFDSGFWFKQDLTFVNIRTVLADMKLVGIRIYEFDRDLAPQDGAQRGIRQLMRATACWKLEQVKVTELQSDGAKVSSMPVWMWETVLKPSILTVYQVAPERLAIATLYDNIRVLGSSAEDVALRDRALGEALLPGDGAGDDDAGAAVRAVPAAAGRHGIPALRRHDARASRSSWSGRLFSYLGVLNAWPPMFSALFPLATFTVLALAMQWYIERR